MHCVFECSAFFVFRNIPVDLLKISDKIDYFAIFFAI